MNKILSLVLLMSTAFVFAQSTDDNEIKITQTGDTLSLTIDQIGFGNKVGGDDGSSGSLSSMTITGSPLTFDLDSLEITTFYSGLLSQTVQVIHLTLLVTQTRLTGTLVISAVRILQTITLMSLVIQTPLI